MTTVSSGKITRKVHTGTNSRSLGTLTKAVQKKHDYKTQTTGNLGALLEVIHMLQREVPMKFRCTS
jgi:hypothetical protein